MAQNRSLDTLLKWTVLVILAVAAVKLVFAVFGIAFVLGGFLLFRVLPLVLLVWAVVWAVRRLGGSGDATNPPAGSAGL